jgi:hypothetical protein
VRKSPSSIWEVCPPDGTFAWCRTNTLSDDQSGDAGGEQPVLKRARPNERDFVVHSLRSDWITNAAAKSARVFKMKEVSRHKSLDVLGGYVRDANLFRDHAGAACYGRAAGCGDGHRHASLNTLEPLEGLVAPIRLAAAVLHRPSSLASIPGLEAARPVKARPTLQASIVRTGAIAQICRRDVAGIGTEIQVDLLRRCRSSNTEHGCSGERRDQNIPHWDCLLFTVIRFSVYIGSSDGPCHRFVMLS